MNWFKHYVNASDDFRVFRLKDEMGYTGLGIYWTIMEMMARGGGCYARAGLMALRNRRTPKERIDRVLDGFGLFHTDADGRVTTVPPAADERPTSGITQPKAEQKYTSECTETKEDTSDSLAYTHVEEKREEKNREEKNPSDSPVEGVMSDDKRRDAPTVDNEENPVIHELRTNRSWQEAVCMNSGYGALLMRHFDRAIDIFLQHVKAGADEVELTDRRRAMNYFRNFTRLSHPAGRALKEELERADIPNGPHPSLPGPHPDHLRRFKFPDCCASSQSPQGEGVDSMARHSTPLPWEGQGGGSASPFEDPPGPNGERSYHGGRPLPPDAPPRPSHQAEWDEAEEKWLMIYEL